MLKLAIIASFFLLTSGIVFHLPDEVQDNDISKDNLPNITVITIGIYDPLWVLSLNDDTLGFEKLRVANRKEEEVFDHDVKPLIRSYRRRPHPITVKKDDPAISESELTHGDQEQDNMDIKQEIMRIINKFAMSSVSEPDAYLPETEQEEGLSLTLYFKGPYTSLMVASGRKQWQYFISPPSPLPAWFYQRHVNVQTNGVEKYVIIPKTVRDDFYKKILHMLQMFLSFPV